jgi:hypothetical protein
MPFASAECRAVAENKLAKPAATSGTASTAAEGWHFLADQLSGLESPLAMTGVGVLRKGWLRRGY